MASSSCVEDSGVVVQMISEEKGRGLIATRDFLKGETLFREKPMVSCQFAWNSAYGYKACHHCMEPLETTQENVTRLTGNPNLLLPNTECCSTRPAFHVSCPACDIKYCSQACLDEAIETYHKTLCVGTSVDHPLISLMDMWKTFHYPPESTSIMLLARILATICQAEPGRREEVVQKYTNLIHDVVDKKANFCHKLMGEQFASQIEILRGGMSQVFGSDPSVQWFLTPDGFDSLLALVGRNGQGVGTSPLSQWVKQTEKLRISPKEKKQLDLLIDKIYEEIDQHAGPFLNNDGSGLFYLQSTINHSCDPNSVVEFPFNNHELVVNATKNISAGEEIYICYLDECDSERSRHSRQKMLQENYLFQCQCQKCRSQQDEPDVTSDEEMSDEDSS